MPRKTSISGSWLAFWLSVILILALLVIGVLVMIERIEKNQYQWEQEVNQTTEVNIERLGKGMTMIMEESKCPTN